MGKKTQAAAITTIHKRTHKRSDARALVPEDGEALCNQPRQEVAQAAEEYSRRLLAAAAAEGVHGEAGPARTAGTTHHGGRDNEDDAAQRQQV